MINSKLRYRVLLAIGIALVTVFAGVAYFYAHSQEQAILAEYERSLHKLTNSVAKGLESVMTEGHAEIMRDYSVRLKGQRGITELVILRTDGSEAFRDNATIDKVNLRLGTPSFATYPNPKSVQNMDPVDSVFGQVLAKGGKGSFELLDKNNHRQFVFLDSIPNGPRCTACHDSESGTRGVIKIVSPMTPIEAAILNVRIQSVLVIGVALILTMLFTGYVLGHSVVSPIESVTGAMMRISSGEFGSTVPLRGGGEIRRMAISFNLMTSNLKQGYDLLLREREKLTTIIEAAREAIVVTDAGNEIVLINSAATELLGKSDQQIRGEGFLNLLDDSELLQRLLHGLGQSGHSETIAYRERKLLVSAASIDDGNGHLIGSAALIRDVTDEQRMMSELKYISITDALTEVFNRRYLDSTLATEFDRVRRTGKPLSVLLLDIDFFKKFNDTHGHDQGDRVLQAVGAAMKSSIRDYDSACRYGGEEFVLILPETDQKGAIIVGERLRLAIEAMVVDGLHVTISLGAATYPMLKVAKAQTLLEAADAALYKAKEGGRNRLVTADATLLAQPTS
jgi:diguanylate cyclase (GGDEF)-like protein/PAS domain S-box-containing protein